MREIRSAVGAREKRFVAQTSAEVRAAGDGATIDGYGALFNRETVIGMWFREVILPGAFKDSIVGGDIRVAFNHDPNYILGRTTAKTATVEEDERGLRYSATPPSTRADVIESIKRRDVTGSSFEFSIESDDDEEWDYSEVKAGKLPLRRIKRCTLFETGPVAWPAYDDTTVSARARDRVEEAKRVREAADAAEQATEAVASAAAPATPEPVVVTQERAVVVDAHRAAEIATLTTLEAELEQYREFER